MALAAQTDHSFSAKSSESRSFSSPRMNADLRQISIMSIALSIMVKPSRLLLAMVGVMCACIVLAGALLGLGIVSELASWSRVAVTAGCIGVAFTAFVGQLRRRSVWWIDISADGQIRLTQAPVATGSQWPGKLVRLTPDSTLWSHLLMLRLQTEDGRSSVLPVLPDSVTKEEFRALAVACRWVAAHNNRAENDNVDSGSQESLDYKTELSHRNT